MFAYELIYFWLNFSSEFPEFPLCLCEEADWCAYLFMHLSVVALHPLFKHGFAMYSQPQVHVCTCTPHPPPNHPQKNLSRPRFSFPISCQAVNEWFEFCRSLLNHTTSVSYMFMTLMVEAGDCSTTERKTNRSPRWSRRFLRLKPMCLLWDWQAK